VLVLEGVSYRHAGARSPALHAIDLTLEDGEVVGIVGPNEAGKSTLCLVAAGLAPRVVGGTLRGRVLLDGEDVAGLLTHELPSRVGIVFQDPDTQLTGVTRTVYEEIAFGPSNLGLPTEEVLARTEAALDELAIRDLEARDPGRLSGGQRQLVAIASILAMRPRHLVLDEPTAQLDPSGTASVGEAIRQLARAGSSILIAEHKTDLLAAIASRMLVLDEGQIVSEGDAQSVLRDPRLPAMGVAPPAPERLLARATAAGVDPSRIPVTDIAS
jgi:energy-coupling factor transporter ATP-binding protein EcfA2